MFENIVFTMNKLVRIPTFGGGGKCIGLLQGEEGRKKDYAQVRARLVDQRNNLVAGTSNRRAFGVGPRFEDRGFGFSLDAFSVGK